MAELTVLFLTANKVPANWASYHKSVLLEAIGDYPLITLSREPMAFGLNVLDDQAEPSLSNIYYQMLRGAKVADTEYVAVAEDDTLYVKEHFDSRPTGNRFAYNMSRLGVFIWLKKPAYFYKPRVSNSTLIAPRELLIEALEERFAKNPVGTMNEVFGELGRNMVERNLGVTLREKEYLYTYTPVVRFDHHYGHDKLAISQRKRMGVMQAYDVYYWGRADELVKKWQN